MGVASVTGHHLPGAAGSRAVRAVKGLVVLEPEQQSKRWGGGERKKCFSALVSKTQQKQTASSKALLYLWPGSRFPRRWLHRAVTSAGMIKGGTGGGVSLSLKECCSGGFSGYRTPSREGMGPASRQHWGGLGHGAELSPPTLFPAAARLVQRSWALGRESRERWG